jgi:ribosome-binding protein aMBF1 (putative translation factor)
MVSGDLLREARRRAGLSQAQLAQRARKPTSVVGRWERGEVTPSLETVRTMIRACGLELGFTLTEQDDSKDSVIAAGLELTPSERLARLEAWAEFILRARENLEAA